MNANNAEWRDFDMDKIKSFPRIRKQSITQGLSYYFTGKPCAKGHLTVRYSLSSSCVICHAAREKARTTKPISTFVRKDKPMAAMVVMGIRINRSLSSNTD